MQWTIGRGDDSGTDPACDRYGRVEGSAQSSGWLVPELGRPPIQYAGIRFLIPQETGEIEEVTGIEQLQQMPGVKEVVCRAEPGKLVDRIVNAYGRLGYIIAVEADASKLHQLLNLIEKVELKMKERVSVAKLSE